MNDLPSRSQAYHCTTFVPVMPTGVTAAQQNFIQRFHSPTLHSLHNLTTTIVPPFSSIFQKCFKKFLVLRGKKFSKPQPRSHSNCDFSLSVTKICISSRTTAIILPLSLQQTLLALSCHQNDVKRKEAKTNSNLQKCNHRLWPNSSSAIHTQLSFEVLGSLWCSARMAPRLPQYQFMAESRAHFLLSVQ